MIIVTCSGKYGRGLQGEERGRNPSAVSACCALRSLSQGLGSVEDYDPAVEEAKKEMRFSSYFMLMAFMRVNFYSHNLGKVRCLRNRCFHI